MSLNTDVPKAKKVARLKDDKGRRATIVLWDDDTVSTIAEGGGGIKEPYISSAKSIDQYFIGLRFYQSLGLTLIKEEEFG